MTDGNTDTAPALVDVKAAAVMCGVDRTTVYRLTASGRFPQPVKIGRLTRWRVGELRAWIAAGCPALSMWEYANGAQKTAKNTRFCA